MSMIRNVHVFIKAISSPKRIQLFFTEIPFSIRFFFFLHASFNWNFKSKSFVLRYSRCRYKILNKYSGFIMCVWHELIVTGSNRGKRNEHKTEKYVFIYCKDFLFLFFARLPVTFLTVRDEWCERNTYKEKACAVFWVTISSREEEKKKTEHMMKNKTLQQSHIYSHRISPFYSEECVDFITLFRCC